MPLVLVIRQVSRPSDREKKLHTRYMLLQSPSVYKDMYDKLRIVLAGCKPVIESTRIEDLQEYYDRHMKGDKIVTEDHYVSNFAFLYKESE